MAASPTPRPTASNPCAAAVADWQAARVQAAAHEPPAVPVVALSGGADSTALLLAARAQWSGPLLALHVHHGLQRAGDDFERHCAQLCARLSVELQVARVDARHAPGESPEDAARRARYAALARLAQDAGRRDVLLAQHADDQVETVLLALSRGAGLPGLAGMATTFERHGVRFHRPLLAVSGTGIRAWLAAAGIAWIEDPSNADTGFTRNRIRHALLPALEAAFPSFRATFARSARHAAEAQALLEHLADDDLNTTGDPPAIALLRRLPRERQANLLRRWLARRQAGASTAQMDELLRQIAACDTRGHGLELKVGAGCVRREGERLAWYNSAVVPPGHAP